MKRFALCSLAAILAAALAPAAADWPTVRHNAQRNPVTPETVDAQRLAKAWHYGGAGAPQPAWHGPAKWDAYAALADLHSMRNYDVVYDVIVIDDRCYLSSSAEHSVVCLDATTGEELWRYVAGGPVRVAPTHADGKLYFGADDGYAYCITTGGEMVWKFSPTADLDRSRQRRLVNNGNLIPLWPVRTGVTVENGTAYFAASMLPWEDSYLCAVDAATGDAEGKGHFVRKLDKMTFEGPLALSRDLVIAPQGRVAPALFARVDGRPMGSLQGGGGAYVVVAGSEVIHGPGNKAGWMTRSKANTRERVATHQQARAVVVRDDMTFLLTKNVLMALASGKTQPTWQTPVDEPLSMIAAGDVLLVGGIDSVQAFDSSNGELLWSGSVEGRAHGLAASNNTLFVSTDTGRVTAFTPSGSVATQSAAAGATGDIAADDRWQPPTPERIDDDNLLARWVFQRPYASGLQLTNLVDDHVASTSSTVRLSRAGEFEALEMSGPGQSFTVAEKLKDVELPTQDLTIEAWVRVDETQPWGAMLCAMQDNGSDEHGWLLGYRDDRFCLAVAGEDGNAGLTYMTGGESFQPGRWYHVAGTYDGETMRLFVDGQQTATSDTQQGAIDYPQKASIELGAYRDANEYYPLIGGLQEVRVYNRVLDADEIVASYTAKQGKFPEPKEQQEADGPRLEIAVGPWLQFTGPGEATIRWRTAAPMPTHCRVESGGAEEGTTYSAPAESTEHEVTLKGLVRNRIYSYTILSDVQGEGLSSEPFECDTFFDYSIPSVADDSEASPAAALVDAIVEQSSTSQGMCLLYDCDDPALPIALARGSRYRVHWFVADDSQAEQFRVSMHESGTAARVTVHSLASLGSGWLTPNLANVIIIGDKSLGTRPADREIKRLLTPSGVALIGVSPDGDAQDWQQISGTPLAGSGDWTHAYGRSDNAAFGGERLSGVGKVDDLQVQWLGRPGPRYQSDRGNRNPPPLAANGRLFTQGLDRMIAVDQYNGTVLWALEIPKMRRYNIPRDCSNWCADDDFVYVAVRDQMWKIDAATGEIVHFDVPDDDLEGNFDWGFAASERHMLIGSAVGAGSSFGEFWGPSKWYDAIQGPDAAKVVSDKLFAASKADGYELWNYQNGLIQNSTITISGEQVMFVETRSEALQQASTRRIESADLFQQQHLVALDVNTGKPLWEKPLAGIDGTTMLSMSATDGHLVMVASHPKQFDITAIDMTAGDVLWTSVAPWPDGRTDHGVHLARPAIMGSRLFLRPLIFDLATGKLLPEKFPVGGCGTYACSENALLFRSGSGGMLSMWSPDTTRYSHFPRLRPNCWLSAVPAGGLLLAPEGGGGCSCGNWMETSLAFIPEKLLVPPLEGE